MNINGKNLTFDSFIHEKRVFNYNLNYLKYVVTHATRRLQCNIITNIDNQVLFQENSCIK